MFDGDYGNRRRVRRVMFYFEFLIFKIRFLNLGILVFNLVEKMRIIFFF